MSDKMKRILYWFPILGMWFTGSMSAWTFDSDDFAERSNRHFITTLGALYHAMCILILIGLLYPDFFNA